MLQPITKETLTPQDFKLAINTHANNIKSTKFIIPKIGSGSFGLFEITYETPVLKEVSVNREYASYV